MATGGARSRGMGQAAVFVLFVALAALSAAVLLAPRATAAEAPYEPNDASPAAAGPLAAGQLYSAGLETASDRDFFFFHVTSRQSALVELTVRNLGVGDASDIDVTIFDVWATPVAARTFIRGGESALLSIELEPQKYFVEVSSSGGFGDPYSLLGGGSLGAFGPYAQIAGRCTKATAAVTESTAGLSRAKSKLQRATAALRRTRYAVPAARRKAQAAHSRAKRQAAARRHALAAARKSRQPWCSIAP